MANTDYLPKSDAELVLWLGNFQSKLATHGPACGLTATEVTDTSTDCTSLASGINNAEAKKAESKAAVAAKETVKKAKLPTLRNTIRRIKTHPGCTAEVRQDLGIDGGDEVSQTKPDFSGKATPNFVDLDFSKTGVDGVNIYGRLKGQSAWTFLARDTQAPYHDTRPLATPGQPEVREYKCISVIADEEVGEESDIISVVFGG